MVTEAGVKVIDLNENAVEAAKVTLMLDFADLLSPQLIDLLAISAVEGARITIEGEQRIKDADIARSKDTIEVRPNGVTSISGSWQRVKYGAIVADDILRAGPNYTAPVTAPTEVEVTPPIGAVSRFGRRVITGENPRYRAGHINLVIDNVLVSEEELLSRPLSADSYIEADESEIVPMTKPQVPHRPQGFFPDPPVLLLEVSEGARQS